MDIHGDKLLRLLGLNRGDRGQEVNKFLGVVPLSVEKIKTILDFFAVGRSALKSKSNLKARRLNLHIYGFFMSGMFQYELFEVEESAFVRNLLAHLYDGSPCVGCKTLCTIRALMVRNDVFNFESLLQDGPLERFLLDSDLYFDSPRMGLRPDKAGVYDPDL